MRNYSRFILALLLGLAVLPPLPADTRPLALDKALPQNVQDLHVIQERVKKVVAKVSPSVVGIRIGNNAGSGVIISKDGYVLTAGHISGKPDRDVDISLPDGRRLKGKTLGANEVRDSGMIRITDEGEWPFVEMGDSSTLRPGAWCLALGHPEGFRKGRTPVLRLGRFLGYSNDKTKRFLRTDCALVGGDSGGPLFDLDGKVIGIHSQIGERMTWNLHVPVDTYRDNWDRLAKGEVWGGGRRPYLGVELDDDCRIVKVDKGSPAEKAGLKANDVVIRFDKDQIEDPDDLLTLIAKQKPGAEVSIRVRRGEKILNLKVVIGRKPPGSASRGEPNP